ncbi:MAG: ribonucleoside triphosphate reductase, partial [Butyrivibrio sp.]|nr:ribonucleoside triphosphate reductase [Butyrivibrio sp.]
GTQAPFSNITLDWTVPKDLANLPVIVGGKELDFTYGDCQHEMDMVNKAFIEIMIEGDANGRGFQYPIPTYSITRDFDWSETENNRLLFEMTAKYGTPYFSNYINSDMEPSDVRSMCCRLRLDLRELRKKSGGFFGSGESTGSIGVVTINLPRIAYQAENEADFYTRLDHLMDIAARSLKTKRTVITKLLEQGLYPYTRRYLGSFSNHFSTIGLIGMNEAGLNAKWIGEDLTHERAQAFAKDVLNHMRERLSDYQEQYGDLYNLEATPAESTTYRFAKHDKEQFPDIITANMDGTPYYTNSSHLPVGYTEDIFSALDVQDELQTLYTSGTVFHAFLGEKLPDWQAAANLVRKIAENYRLPYYTMSPTYSICRDHGYLVGEQHVCPHCGKKTEVYSRITGYYRPVANWNDGKVQEYHDRKNYVVGESVLTRETKEQPAAEAHTVREAAKRAAEEAEHILLFKTQTCPNCSIATKLLDAAGISYTMIDANAKPELAEQYSVMQAPTLILEDQKGYEKYSGISDIRGWLKEKAS